ncbi:DinB family protein [Nocardioides sp. R-C-SC26]|uniref:DinB family protein n=1 Tax=Nocardioides sp. R-C-SC26 TaxID=2870414 RepID=UPI001E626B0C|nr:DinB family protein [Nocardioides sp. R-C-SC26]
MVTTTAPERQLLEEMLDAQRRAVAALLDDVDETEARERLVPSLTTVLGLVRHATFVELVWFHARVDSVARRDLGLPDTVDESFLLGDDDTVDSVRAAYLAACERSRAIAVEHELDEEWDWHRARVSLRFIYAHMIAELARHAGHGDILVEQLRARRPQRSRG